MRKFTRIIEEPLIKMGYVGGSDKVLFIKCGQGGSIYGYENKYLELALSVNEKYGFTVFVSEIVNDGKEAYEREMELVRLLVGESCRVYFLGISKGGLLLLWHGNDSVFSKRIVTVNAPLMINFHNRTRPAINKLDAEKLTMIYGTKDPSFSYVPFLSSCTDVQIIDGADHNLIGGNVGLDVIVEEMLTE